ncbi:molybdate ABC transporter substrate-binding protein [Devosia pacifica]|uniref:Molybdate ABC transporter substrate-binding protein n=1 Tax=Devosia pacifica TaxID=1335967 RepID=A0A918S8B1_9HYPH|nr:molybdate ABC transporter substrate-binding protein [Devosia pacifica]GHA26890.1 molybdate ABC transporter substrate-binding protein [Devosia pacifica]
MRAVLVVLACLAFVVPAHAGRVTVAVAANFTETAEELAALFSASTGHEVDLSFAATGQLYAQISQGAPFDVFLAADQVRAEQAIATGLAVEDSRFTYALGQLVLYSPEFDLGSGAEVLSGDFSHLAIADPEAAPYGMAAIETLKALGLETEMRPRLVFGASVTQALQFAESGNAELAFVAASQVRGAANRWVVPQDLYSPIAQDAVLLDIGADNPAALAFIDFLKGETAVRVIEDAGYRVP